MAGILQQLSGNPLSTPIGQRIEKATEPKDCNDGEDWGLIMEICDAINDTDEGPRDAIRAIKKRFQQYAGRDNEVVMSTLIVLETCVKNCGRRFHLLVTSKDFVQDLFKLIGPKNEPSTALQEKVLNLIQSWAEAFRSQPEMNGVVSVYRELKSKGIEFPSTDLDSMAPIHTPQRTAPVTISGQHNSQQSQQRSPTQGVLDAAPINVTSEQLDKLKSDLCLVQENMSIFDSMLNEMTPGNEHADDWALLRELNSTCRQMQQRVVELIDQVTNEEFTSELLRVNDELNNLFVRYDRFIKKHSPEHANCQATANPNIAASLAHPSSQTTQEESSLIDLDDDDSKPSVAVGGEQFLSRFSHMKVTDNSAKSKTTTGIVAGQLASNVQGDDFDQFAQSRLATATSSSTNSKIPHELGEALLLDREEDFEEMEKWLKEQETFLANQEKDVKGNNSSLGDGVRSTAEATKWLTDSGSEDKKQKQKSTSQNNLT